MQFLSTHSLHVRFAEGVVNSHSCLAQQNERKLVGQSQMCNTNAFRTRRTRFRWAFAEVEATQRDIVTEKMRQSARLAKKLNSKFSACRGRATKRAARYVACSAEMTSDWSRT